MVDGKSEKLPLTEFYEGPGRHDYNGRAAGLIEDKQARRTPPLGYRDLTHQRLECALEYLDGLVYVQQRRHSGPQQPQTGREYVARREAAIRRDPYRAGALRGPAGAEKAPERTRLSGVEGSRTRKWSLPEGLDSPISRPCVRFARPYFNLVSSLFLTVDEFDQTLDTQGDPAPGQAPNLASGDVVPATSRGEQPAVAPRTGPLLRPHRELVVQNLTASLIGALRDGARRVLLQQSVKLCTGDTVRPDICVLRDAEALSSKDRSHRDAIQLIVDVSSDALQYDFDRLERYALAGVPEVWIVDLQRHRLLVYQMPSGNGFAKRQLLVAPERMGLLQLPSVELKVAWIFAERDARV